MNLNSAISNKISQVRPQSQDVAVDFPDVYTSSVETFNVRFFRCIVKVINCLHDIESILLEKFETKYDFEDDIIQREKRISNEFGKRFSRIYLYSLCMKISKLEDEIVSFNSGSGCRIAQSFVLRDLIISVYDILLKSLQEYVKYLKKSKICSYLKLKELLRYTSHIYENTKIVVQHEILDFHNITEICKFILEMLSCKECGNKGGKIKKKQTSAMVLRNNNHKKGSNTLKSNVNRPASAPGKNRTKTTVSYTEVVSRTDVRDNQFESDDVGIEDVDRLLHKISLTSSRICDDVLEKLINEVTTDITECIQQLAIDVFHSEFK